MIGKVGLQLFLIIAVLSIFLRLQIPSRSVLILFGLIAPPLLLFRVWLTRLLLDTGYRQGMLGERTAIIGTPQEINLFLEGIEQSLRLELQIVASHDPSKSETKEILRQIRNDVIGRVVFVSPEHQISNELAGDCEAEGMEVWVVASALKGLHGIPKVTASKRTRFFVFHRSSTDFWYKATKRLIDIVGSIAGLLLFSPLFLIIALAIKHTSPGPIFFNQYRSGKRGRRFKIHKFRSMIPEAPSLHEGLASRNEMNGPVFKIAKDPRVTPIGAILRRTSLDEIPQLLNVLKGEMSLVGPRPLPDYETEQIEKSAHRRRLSVKPGITCLWQIRGRSSISKFEDWVDLDLEYIDRASTLLDLWILFRTIPEVLFMRGSH
jgi:exopolysaccharide biosynthesis polyprenyl glycosylphosphotransferase